MSRFPSLSSPRSSHPSRRTARGAGRTAALLGLVALAAGCGSDDAGNRSEPGPRLSDDVVADPTVVERLRALGYAGSTPADDGAPTGVVARDPERVQPGYRLVTIQRLSRADLIDERGDLVRSWSHEPSEVWERAEHLADGGLLVIGAETHDWGDDRSPFRIADEARYLLRLDRDGGAVWKRPLTVHHDIEVTPDGRLAALAFERRVVPLIDREIPVRDDRIAILDPTDGSLLETCGFLSSVLGRRTVFPLAAIPSDELGGEPWIDLFHANSLEWMREADLFGTHPLYSPGHVLVCFRNQDRVAIFDVEKCSVVWAWGENDLRGPHDAQLLPGGTILLLDNGLGRDASRALEIDPRTNEIVWEWQADPPEAFYTPSKGSVQRLPNGNVLLAESDAGRAIEIAPDGEIVWEWFCPHFVAPGQRATIVRMVWVGSDR